MRLIVFISGFFSNYSNVIKLEVITDQCSVFNLKLAVGIVVGFFD